MPELPEVEVVRGGLIPAVTDAVVTRVRVLDERSLRRHPGPSEDFIDRLTGVCLAYPSRRGKYLWLPFHGAAGATTARREAFLPPSGHASSRATTPEALVVHLGMSGQVLLRDPDAGVAKLTRIVLDLAQPGYGPLRLDFVDQRIFGSMAIDALVPTPDEPGERVPASVSHIARDPLDPHFDDRAFLDRLARRDTTIKRALLDQTLVSGIGNIYSDEALWAARIHYDQPTRTLSRARARTLLAEVRVVLQKALGEGGTSFDAQYVNVNGASGYFSHSLNAYGQHGKPCPRCGTGIVRETFMNRGSHFCPRCQRIR
ncbi:bifunctional DNA-formamidopyrimidine glycosylase/DNA-(apurinic or apyrimidinic site) lyase [Protaetiibacter sp. SSC-01]|uniref:bifunctional DNA-formamidopyrimidine glycosylase/DNA-(apurinic or apyrimidinic site) lyase n=1 Tax=Protaetiibacter sp. SSC-01 TaxID=2759943 RepID=UPI001656F963|nr:bifunctional DNA-formamidopyrimidine glycosylase/DNA-(apurinic or apyrimidinic site) lyase [Protaetiibacter sp. SSC-01]QNO38202.1 bifunctional DNA-formamidopyrimidine glycosylase/DNA-(apurinic or apyrimidinic site) lyase [Protaetiibacter sp. SSC-01]